MEDKRNLHVQIPVDLNRALNMAAAKRDGMTKTQITIEALKAWLITDLDWNQSKKLAILKFEVLDKEHPVILELTPTQALNLREQIDKQLNAIGIKEVTT